METVLNTFYSIIPFVPDQAAQVTAFWRESFNAVIGIEPVHSFESQAYFLTEILPQSYSLFVAVDHAIGQPIAFIAFSESDVSQLYVDIRFQGKGLGSALLNLAIEQSSGSLKVRTFEVNENARRFYEKHGFVAIGGDSDNEEGLPDILYEWTRA